MSEEVEEPTDGSLPKLRRLPVPVREPRAASRVRRPEVHGIVPHTQGTLALAVEAAPGAEAETVPSRHLRAVPALPDPAEWAGTFLLVALEVTSGMRSPAQLIRWTTPTLQMTMARRGALSQRMHRMASMPQVTPVVRSLRFCSPREDVHEVAAVVADRDRVKAVAFRMEALDDRWRVTAFEMC